MGKGGSLGLSDSQPRSMFRQKYSLKRIRKIVIGKHTWHPPLTHLCTSLHTQHTHKDTCIYTHGGRGREGEKEEERERKREERHTERQGKVELATKSLSQRENE